MQDLAKTIVAKAKCDVRIVNITSLLTFVKALQVPCSSSEKYISIVLELYLTDPEMIGIVMFNIRVITGI
jgi:hypothetical protein